MTPGAIESLAFCVQPVRVHIIEIVYVTRQVIAAMAIETGIVFLVALPAPFAVESGPVTMLMPPFGGMNIGQGNMIIMAKSTAITRLHAVMA